MKSIFFSLVIPTYNRANFIINTLKSIESQTFDNFEVIIVDDGGNDDTQTLVESFKNPKFSYYKKPNGERGAARNYGIFHAKGEYITFLDSDDGLYPHHLQIAHGFILENDFPPFFHSGYEIKNERNEVIRQVLNKGGNLNDKLLKGNFLSCIGVFVQKEIIKRNLFNEERALAGSEDYELWMRLASQYPLLSTQQLTAFMVQHNGRSVINFNEQKLEKRINMVRQSLQDNETVSSYFKDKIHIMSSRLDMYLALHLLMKRNKKKALKYITSAIKSDPGVIFTRNMISLAYKLIYN